MTNHLNFFVPFQSAAAWHENQLTRALLVVLRYSPMAHQAWLNFVSPGRALQTLPPAEFATQRQRVVTKQEPPLDGDAIPGISVWLAPDAKQVNAIFEVSDRQQVLDAIITYGSELVVVVENKINWGEPTEQPHRINLHGAPVKFQDQPRSVRWQDVLAMLSDLVDRNLVHGAERSVICDFLDFVEEHFPNIGPYSTISRCGNNRFRLERRLDAIQGIAVGGEEGKGLGWRDFDCTPKIFMAWLGYPSDAGAVSLRMYPADTLGQARALFSDPTSVQNLIALRSKGWRVEPNFHWGFMAGGYAWASSPCSVEKYCTYWVENIGQSRELSRSEWTGYLDTLEADCILDTSGKEAFDREFTASQRQKAHPRPGLFCEYTWPLLDAAGFDARGLFANEVRSRINQMLVALQAPTLGAG
ncbi:hypothetical protein [Dyella telluris]|uniref:Uncharacterized protein n=1 Tax=Dyella telluris TaxID=2763498 RepID=A0A7G8Q3L2_9GAMM|nr:hypothetical protein [Dyella telluris]QNK01370.1 hypothetical protein H8F01_20410 [Dyella telluris]